MTRTIGTSDYDEKGNLKKYAPEELAKMRHDMLPGYKAELADVLPGQAVYLYLRQPNAKEKQNGKVDVADIIGGNTPAGAAHGPIVRGVLILSATGIDVNEPIKKRKI